MNISVALLCALALVSQNTALPTDAGISKKLTVSLKDQFFQYLAKLYLDAQVGVGGLPDPPPVTTGVPPVAPGVPPVAPGVPGSPVNLNNTLDLAVQISTYKDSLFKSIADHHYDDAVISLKAIINLDKVGNLLTDILNQLFATKADLLTLASSLLTNGLQDIVTKHFPDPVKDVVQGKLVYIKNVGYNQYISCKGEGEKEIRAVAEKKAELSSFKSVPSGVSNNTAVFKFFNDKLKLYISLDPTPDSVGDRELRLTEDANDESSKFTLELWQADATAPQYIINSVLYSQPLKLAVGTNSDGSRYAYTNGEEKPNSSRVDARFHFTFQAV